MDACIFISPVPFDSRHNDKVLVRGEEGRLRRPGAGSHGRVGSVHGGADKVVLVGGDPAVAGVVGGPGLAPAVARAELPAEVVVGGSRRVYGGPDLHAPERAG